MLFFWQGHSAISEGITFPILFLFSAQKMEAIWTSLVGILPQHYMVSQPRRPWLGTFPVDEDASVVWWDEYWKDSPNLMTTSGVPAMNVYL
jgi:hypothetical protein